MELFGSSGKSPKSLNEVQQYLRSLFLLDRGRYVALSDTDRQRDPQADGIIQELMALHHDRATPVSIEEVYCFECALLQLEPIDKIRRMAWNTRAVYRALAGPGQYDLYLKSDPPDLQGLGPATGTSPGAPLSGAALDANAAALRADMHMLTGETFRILSLIPQREQLRNTTARSIGLQLIAFWVAVLGLGLAVNVLGPYYGRSGQVWVIFPVCIAGATGAFISVQRRLQILPINEASTLGFYALYYGRKSLLLSPIAGIVFSGLLYLVFGGGLVKGDLFPVIVNSNVGGSSAARAAGSPKAPTKRPANADAHPDASPSKVPAPDAPGTTAPAVKTAANSAGDPAEAKMNFLDYAYHTGPANGTEWAKLLVWSFLAGFAEQLVPDILNRISSRQAAIENTKEVKTG